jgi:hypothetical protein
LNLETAARPDPGTGRDAYYRLVTLLGKRLHINGVSARVQKPRPEEVTMSTSSKNDQTTNPIAQAAGIVLASLLALTAIVSAVVAPTDLSGRPVSSPTVVASN